VERILNAFVMFNAEIGFIYAKSLSGSDGDEIVCKAKAKRRSLGGWSG
jgi:hypothetical protein